MGRHRAPPPQGAAPPRAPIAIGAGALLVALSLLIGVFVAVRGGGDDSVTARPSTKPSSSEKSSSEKSSSQKSSAAPSSTATPTGPASTTAPTTARPATTPPSTTSTPASTTKRPPTLNLKMTGTSFVTIRLPNRLIVVSKLFHKGQRQTFDHKELRVLLGNAAAVQVTVNGKPRKPGRKGQVDIFTVRRK